MRKLSGAIVKSDEISKQLIFSKQAELYSGQVRSHIKTQNLKPGIKTLIQSEKLSKVSSAEKLQQKLKNKNSISSIDRGQGNARKVNNSNNNQPSKILKTKKKTKDNEQIGLTKNMSHELMTYQKMFMGQNGQKKEYFINPGMNAYYQNKNNSNHHQSYFNEIRQNNKQETQIIIENTAIKKNHFNKAKMSSNSTELSKHRRNSTELNAQKKQFKQYTNRIMNKISQMNHRPSLTQESNEDHSVTQAKIDKLVAQIQHSANSGVNQKSQQRNHQSIYETVLNNQSKKLVEQTKFTNQTSSSYKPQNTNSNDLNSARIRISDIPNNTKINTESVQITEHDEKEQEDIELNDSSDSDPLSSDSSDQADYKEGDVDEVSNIMQCGTDRKHESMVNLQQSVNMYNNKFFNENQTPQRPNDETLSKNSYHQTEQTVKSTMFGHRGSCMNQYMASKVMRGNMLPNMNSERINRLYQQVSQTETGSQKVTAFQTSINGDENIEQLIENGKMGFSVRDSKDTKQSSGNSIQERKNSFANLMNNFNRKNLKTSRPDPQNENQLITIKEQPLVYQSIGNFKKSTQKQKVHIPSLNLNSINETGSNNQTKHQKMGSDNSYNPMMYPLSQRIQKTYNFSHKNEYKVGNLEHSGITVRMPTQNSMEFYSQRDTKFQNSGLQSTPQNGGASNRCGSDISNNMALQVALQSELNGPTNFVECNTQSNKGTEKRQMEASQSLSIILSNNHSKMMKAKSNERVFEEVKIHETEGSQKHTNIRQRVMEQINPDLKVSLISISEPRDCMLGSYTSTNGMMEAGPKDLPSQIHKSLSPSNSLLQNIIDRQQQQEEDYHGFKSDTENKENGIQQDKSSSIDLRITNQMNSNSGSQQNIQNQIQEVSNIVSLHNLISKTGCSFQDDSQISDNNTAHMNQLGDNGHHSSFDHLNILNQAAAGIQPSGPMQNKSFKKNSNVGQQDIEFYQEIEKDTEVFDDDESPLKDQDLENQIDIMESHNINSLQNHKYFRKFNLNDDVAQSPFSEPKFDQEEDKNGSDSLKLSKKAESTTAIPKHVTQFAQFSKNFLNDAQNEHSGRNIQDLINVGDTIKVQSINKNSIGHNALRDSKNSFKDGTLLTANFNLSMSNTGGCLAQTNSYLNTKNKDGSSFMYSQSNTSKLPMPIERGTLSNLMKDEGSVEDDVFCPRDSNTPSISHEQDLGSGTTMNLENQVQTFGITPKTLDIAIQKQQSSDVVYQEVEGENMELNDLKLEDFTSQNQIIQDENELNEQREILDSRNQSMTEMTIQKLKSPKFWRNQGQSHSASRYDGSEKLVMNQFNDTPVSYQFGEEQQDNDDEIDRILHAEDDESSKEQMKLNTNFKVSDSINSFIFQNNTRQIQDMEHKYSKSSKIENEIDEDILLYGSRETETEQNESEHRQQKPALSEVDISVQLVDNDIDIGNDSQPQLENLNSDSEQCPLVELSRNEKHKIEQSMQMQTIERYKKQLKLKLDQDISTPSVSQVLDGRISRDINTPSIMEPSEFNHSKLSKFMSGVKLQSKKVEDQPFEEAKNSDELLIVKQNSSSVANPNDQTSELSQGEEDVSSSHSMTEAPASEFIRDSQIQKENSSSMQENSSQLREQPSAYIEQTPQSSKQDFKYQSGIKMGNTSTQQIHTSTAFRQPQQVNRQCQDSNSSQHNISRCSLAQRSHSFAQNSNPSITKALNNMQALKYQAEKQQMLLNQIEEMSYIDESQMSGLQQLREFNNQQINASQIKNNLDSILSSKQSSGIIQSLSSRDLRRSRSFHQQSSNSGSQLEPSGQHSGMINENDNCGNCSQCKFEKSKYKIIKEGLQKYMDINTYLISEIEKLGQPPAGRDSHVHHQGSVKENKEIHNAYHTLGDLNKSTRQKNTSSQTSINMPLKSPKAFKRKVSNQQPGDHIDENQEDSTNNYYFKFQNPQMNQSIYSNTYTDPKTDINNSAKKSNKSSINNTAKVLKSGAKTLFF